MRPRAIQPSKALARQLTRNDPDECAKARTLYDWVRHNIRCVFVYIGENPANPHHVTQVLANRYGDCKDHVALYGALLAAVGIHSEPALIGLGTVYTLPSVPGYGSGAIDHVITWLPDLQLYADTTADDVSFGFLPTVDMDRPVLLVDSAVLSRTPATLASERKARLNTDVKPDGAADYTYWVEHAGVMTDIERTRLGRVDATGSEQIAQNRLRESNLRGTGVLTSSDLAATSGPFSTTQRGTLDDVVRSNGATALPALTSLSGGIAPQVRDWLVERARTQPYICVGGRFLGTAQIVLPENIHITSMPDNLDQSSGFFKYHAHYSLDPATHTIRITWTLGADFGKQACSPGDFQTALPALRKTEWDTRQQIIVRMTS
ncbi:transglutaminase-like domain-containing protein [Caballeronia sp. LZ033]|uniref:transglutaminase-like domain-containing protein n=1 Tax=Caballeronia sp. LZ033 TaxID=3038566 RepID=UPI0028613543|nr:transglutaminase-like domain-containing protein [Caballeronia sp. LZ033]MDR5817998.1 transglutaminase-like domain-containing protein [Caballeronia sp. LZ033]